MEVLSYLCQPLDSRMYCLIENQSAIIIDPCVDESLKKVLEQKEITKILVLLTHEHYDHISGVNWIRDICLDTHVFCSCGCARNLRHPEDNLSAFSEVLLMDMERENNSFNGLNFQPYSCEADETFEGEYEFIWQGHKIFLKETPGHSKGSICILVDEKILFSGDTLVTGHETILRLPGGSKKDFANITLPYLESLEREIMVYPGHGKPQKLAEFMN